MDKVTPGPIPGKLKAEDLNQFLELVRDRTVLQIGCYCGRATVALARHARRTWVLENFNYAEGAEGIVEELKASIERYAPEDSEINLLYGTAEGWAVPVSGKELPQHDIEVVYRDANRVGIDDTADTRLALELLRRRGGVYAWHDPDYNLRWLQVQPLPVEVN